MRKLLLGTAAVALGLTFGSVHANAQVKLELGGHAKLYGTWVSQDTQADNPDTAITSDATNESVHVRNLDMARDTEIHFTGETTLDNGLTVGFHTEALADGSNAAGGGDSFDVQESYAYFSGAWGRVNFGAEDGATYLLQVAAPSADSNYDGLRQFINPINQDAFQSGDRTLTGASSRDSIKLADLFGVTDHSVNGAANASLALNGRTGNDIIVDTGNAGGTAGDIRFGSSGGQIPNVGKQLDYENAVSGYENKLTYMTPVFNGFQGGISYTPELGSGIGTSGTNGNNLDNQPNDYGEVWELAGRYEGQLDQVGVTLGGGWSHANLEKKTNPGNTNGCGQAIFYNDLDGNGQCTSASEVRATRRDREAWNVGADLNWKAFGLGGGYTEDNMGVTGSNLRKQTWFVGGDYTTGPFKLGASYLAQNQNFATASLNQDRWTGGVVYTYGPGMTFRGSVSYVDYKEDLGQRKTNNDSAKSTANATTVLLGTQINF